MSLPRPEVDATRTVTLMDGRTGETVEERLEVEVLDGPDKGARHSVPDGRLVVGSSEDAQVVVRDSTVSRRHAELFAVRQGIRVVDLGSKNGTRVGGARVQEALLTTDGEVELGSTRLRVRVVRSAAPSGPTLERFGAYLTTNRALGATLGQLERASRGSAATVLLEGETGTGKELLARAVHAASPRASGPFVVVDCGAVSPSLLESELFGHVQGAFTGANADRVGAFEAANGGTLFLDELGELPLDLQPKLLRAIEARTVRRLGETADRPFDARFVAATHRGLEAMVDAGTFRADLFFRVAVVRVQVPPLRARPEDVPLLAAHYVHSMSNGQARLAPEALPALTAYDWPGNARELRNVIERALALRDGDLVTTEALFGAAPTAAPTFHEAKDQLVAAFERRYVEGLLGRHRGNVSQAAKEAGLSRNALYALMKRAGVAPDKG